MPNKAGARLDEKKSGGAPAGDPSGKFPFPPPDFDPLQASPATLAKYGLPPRPDAKQQPALLAAWLRLFERPLTFVRPPPKPVFELARKPALLPIVPNETRFGKSSNWCGASIVPNDGQQFVQVFGEWTVPTPDLPPQLDQGPKGQVNDYHCSTWVGLDGNRRYLDSSLPQVGTEQVLTIDANGNRKYDYFAWFQWWARHQIDKGHRTLLTKIPVTAGVSVMAMVWAIDPQRVVAVLRSYAPLNRITILVRRAPDVWLTDAKTSTIRPAISGATAQWIHERPLTIDSKLELFAKYDPVRFRHCVAGTADAFGPATSEETLTAPRFFRLFEVPEPLPPQARLISMPSLISTTSIEVSYGGFPD